MNTLQEIKDAMGRITRGERQSLALWMGIFSSERVEEAAEIYTRGYRHPRISVEKYLQLEDEGGLHHEYADGVIYAMSMPSIAHGHILGDLYVPIYAHLRGTPCVPFMGGLKVRFKVNRADIVYCPDLMVVCGREGIERQYVRFPTLIIEVLSPSTERVDRREKLMSYTQIDSVEEYVLVAQEIREVTIHRRQEGWAPQVLREPEEMVEFRSIGLSVPLARLYERVTFEPGSDGGR